MNWELISEIIRSHRGRLGGTLIGMLFGIFTVTLGFFKALFIIICIILGYIIGSRLDADKGFRQMLQRFFGEW